MMTRNIWRKSDKHCIAQANLHRRAVGVNGKESWSYKNSTYFVLFIVAFLNTLWALPAVGEIFIYNSFSIHKLEE